MQSDSTFVQAILRLSLCQLIHFERSIVGATYYIEQPDKLAAIEQPLLGGGVSTSIY